MKGQKKQFITSNNINLMYFVITI